MVPEPMDELLDHLQVVAGGIIADVVLAHGFQQLGMVVGQRYGRKDLHRILRAEIVDELFRKDRIFLSRLADF